MLGTDPPVVFAVAKREKDKVWETRTRQWISPAQFPNSFAAAARQRGTLVPLDLFAHASHGDP